MEDGKKYRYSVIIPVYNAEKTLERCLDSLCCQGRTDVQIIAVDDGSADGSLSLLNEYARRYPFLEVISQPNSGVSEARNRGIDAATGTYLTFVDSDDFVSEDYFEVLDRCPDCDLLVFASEKIGQSVDESELYQKLKEAESWCGKIALLISSRKLLQPWNKRFRRQIVEEGGIRFPKDFQVGEDFDFCMRYTLRCDTIETAHEVLYHVDISDQSSLSRRYRPNLDETMTMIYHRISESIRQAALPAEDERRILTALDALYVKLVISCVAEQFKHQKPDWRKDRKRYHAICERFRKRLHDGGYQNAVHFVIRFLLDAKLDVMIYLVAFAAKGRKFRPHHEVSA